MLLRDDTSITTLIAQLCNIAMRVAAAKHGSTRRRRRSPAEASKWAPSPAAARHGTATRAGKRGRRRARAETYQSPRAPAHDAWLAKPTGLFRPRRRRPTSDSSSDSPCARARAAFERKSQLQSHTHARRPRLSNKFPKRRPKARRRFCLLRLLGKPHGNPPPAPAFDLVS